MSHPVLTLGYSILAVSIVVGEWRRTRFQRADLMSCVALAFLLAIAVPSAFLYALLGSFRSDGPGQSRLLSAALENAEPRDHRTLFLMTCGSWVALATGHWLAGGRRRSSPSHATPESARVRRFSLRILLLSWLVGLVAINIMVRKAGKDTVWESIGEIGAGYRVAWNSPYRGFLDANAFALLNELVPFALFGLAIGGGWRWLRTIATVEFAFLSTLATGSRRAILVLALVLGIYWMNVNPRRVLWLAAVTVPVGLVLILFGRGMLRFIAGHKLEVYAEVAASTGWDRTAYVASEVGVSQVESLRTLQWFDGPVRLGQDHLLSLLRLFPEQSLLGIEFAPRFTRHATLMHVGDTQTNDIPVGFVGSLWVDAYWFGLAFAGLFAFLLTRLDHWIDARGATSAVGWYARACLGYLLVFPFMNTGSLDYTLAPAPVVVIAMCVLIIMAHRPASSS